MLAIITALISSAIGIVCSSRLFPFYPFICADFAPQSRSHIGSPIVLGSMSNVTFVQFVSITNTDSNFVCGCGLPLIEYYNSFKCRSIIKGCRCNFCAALTFAVFSSSSDFSITSPPILQVPLRSPRLLLLRHILRETSGEFVEFPCQVRF